MFETVLQKSVKEIMAICVIQVLKGFTKSILLKTQFSFTFKIMENNLNTIFYFYLYFHLFK